MKDENIDRLSEKGYFYCSDLKTRHAGRCFPAGTER